jgi:UDP-N-acetylglucosamine transferase subunit ALG13
VIFVTTGSLFPFDRMIRAVDALAPSMPDQRFFAQIGESDFRPQNIAFAKLLTRRDFSAKASEADVIVAHAGMGSVLTALELCKPIILVPRRLELGEHNTDHQMATARWLSDRPGVHVCFDEAEIGPVIRSLLDGQEAGSRMPPAAPAEFVRRLHDLIAAD